MATVSKTHVAPKFLSSFYYCPEKFSVPRVCILPVKIFNHNLTVLHTVEIRLEHMLELGQHLAAAEPSVDKLTIMDKVIIY